MLISEVIAKLSEIQKEHGDLNVAVQFRDNGGDYYGCDSGIRLQVNEEAPVYKLKLNQETNTYEERIETTKVLLL